MQLTVKAAIEGRVSEVRDGYAVIRGDKSVQTYNLDWYRLERGERSMVELRRPDGDDAA